MSIFKIDYRLNVWRTKSPELLLMSPDCLIVLEKLLQRDDENPAHLPLSCTVKDNSVAFKSNVMKHQQSGDLRDGWTVMSSQTHPGYGKCADIRSTVTLMLIWDVCVRLAPCLSPNQSVSKHQSQTSA